MAVGVTTAGTNNRALTNPFGQFFDDFQRTARLVFWIHAGRIPFVARDDAGVMRALQVPSFVYFRDRVVAMHIPSFDEEDHTTRFSPRPHRFGEDIVLMKPVRDMHALVVAALACASC